MLPGLDLYYSTLPELRADLFSRHVSPVKVYVFVAVDERDEDDMSDGICRRCKK